MASRSSAHYTRENYLGSWRGREISQDIGWEMFPQKTEQTIIWENPDSVNIDQRQTIMNFSPDTNSMLEQEKPRRNTHSKERLNIREYGLRYQNMPYANEDFDTQFHDHDPRYYLTEQPWQNYRYSIEHLYKEKDFKDDGDYSITGGLIHPNTLYKRIRSTQNWLKAMFKNFDTSFDNRQNGGIGVLKTRSDLEFIEKEEKMAENTPLDIEEPEHPQNTTMSISNIVHTGSKFLYANTTTDHKVKVASYGKLYKSRGLIPHEHQMRIMEDDTKWSRAEGRVSIPRNLIAIMTREANKSAASSTREKNQLSQEIRNYPQQENENRNLTILGDIMALLGITEQEVKFLESEAGKNKKKAKLALAQLQWMVENIQKLTPYETSKIRDELILATGGLKYPDSKQIRANRSATIINPKIIQFAESQIRSAASHEDPSNNLSIVDPEGKLKMETMITIPRNPTPGDRLDNIWETEQDIKKRDEKTIYSYHQLAKKAEEIERNRRMTALTQEQQKSQEMKVIKQQQLQAPYEAMVKSEIDNTFGENKALQRYVGRIGTKQMRKHMDTDYYTYDNMLEATSQRKIY
ncbi:MAG: hypothetical protein QW303_02035 [Nitrososphaerota archaeon]